MRPVYPVTIVDFRHEITGGRPHARFAIRKILRDPFTGG